MHAKLCSDQITLPYCDTVKTETFFILENGDEIAADVKSAKRVRPNRT